MSTPILVLDAEDVTMAMSDQTGQWLLDPATGKLCMERSEAALIFGREYAEDWAPTDPARVLEIPHFSSSDGYRLMETFALKHASEAASNHLLSALEQRKPFRRFKDALGEFSDDRRRWFEFETEEMKLIAEDFYEAEGYTVRWLESPGEPTGLLG
jgi:hypothetical protein